MPIWIGDPTSGSAIGPYLEGIWVGQIGGDLVPVDVVDPVGENARAADSYTYYLGPDVGGNGWESTLWQVDESGEARRISRVGSSSTSYGSTAGGYAIASRTGLAIVSRTGATGRDGGVASVSLNTGEVASILPPKPDEGPAAGLATTSDGRTVAAGRCANGDGDLTMDAFVDGDIRSLEIVGLPIGFDADNRLVYWPTCTRQEINRATLDGAIETLIDGEVNEARVTPDGRYLIGWSPEEFQQDQPLTVVDLEDGDRWSLEIDGDWRLTGLGDNGFAVLEGSPGAPANPRQPMVVSLSEEWAVILPQVGEPGG